MDGRSVYSVVHLGHDELWTVVASYVDKDRADSSREALARLSPGERYEVVRGVLDELEAAPDEGEPPSGG